MTGSRKTTNQEVFEHIKTIMDQKQKKKDFKRESVANFTDNKNETQNYMLLDLSIAN